jgi:putative addiction module component (TIGR02574 family)
MSERAKQILEQALALPETERARVVAELLASLDRESDEDAEAEWATEITRRARRAHADPDGGIDWDTARQEIRDSIRKA